jgi:hypothetical protein
VTDLENARAALKRAEGDLAKARNLLKPGEAKTYIAFAEAELKIAAQWETLADLYQPDPSEGDEG